MGSLFRPKYTDRHGAEREISVWRAKYYVGGKAIRESTETADLGEAEDFLKRKEGDASRGRVTQSTERRVLFGELTWPQVDFVAGIVRLEPGTTKNREARQFPFTEELRAVLTEQREKADRLKARGRITP